MVTLINPNLVAHKRDLFTTGIVYMPIGLAYVAAFLRSKGIDVQVIDAFAEKPRQARSEGDFLLFGLDYEQVAQRITDAAGIVFIYAINLTSHMSTVGIIRAVRKTRPSLLMVVLENTQAVTAYSLEYVRDEFYKAGADYILAGEGEYRSMALVQALKSENKAEELKKIEGLGFGSYYSRPVRVIEDLDSLPFPAWDLFPLKNYWGLHFGHGPINTNSYLPLLTSRGCPYLCKFCVSASTNEGKWRFRSAGNVVDEIEYFIRKHNVKEFHIEDLNPTISEERIKDICNEILKRKINVIWKIVAGTKVETIRDNATIRLMHKAGCRYISISPESGSMRVLQLMSKSFNLGHAARIIAQMNKSGIRSQGCFILGYQGETKEDLKMTFDLVRNLTKKGLDEVALFILSPVPGSPIFSDFGGYASLSELNFSPSWRKDYNYLNRFRLRLYLMFLLWKLIYHPLKILSQPFNFIFKNFKTKMEMVPFRALSLELFVLQSLVIGRLKNLKKPKEK